MIKICLNCDCEFEITNIQARRIKYCPDCKSIIYNLQSHLDKKAKKKHDRKYYLTHKEKLLIAMKEYYEKNKDKIKQQNKISGVIWRETHKEELIKIRKIYKQTHKKEIKEYRKNYRKKTNVKLRMVLSHRISEALKHNYKSAHTMELIGCSIHFLKSWLSFQFTKGMTWENYGKWHIDHIRPCASFDLRIPEHQQVCFNYTNLRPLWAKDNLEKSDKYEFVKEQEIIC